MIEYIKDTSRAKRIVAVGNPPYQESDGGGVNGRSAKPIYNHFVKALIEEKAISQILLVIPARWFSGGKGLDKFREEMLTSKSIKELHVFKDPRVVFPTVDINGGVCFFLYDKTHDGYCAFSDGIETKDVDLSKLDAIPDDIAGYALIEKVRRKTKNSMADIVRPRNTFGISTKSIGRSADKNERKYPCLTVGRREVKVPESLVTRNNNLIETYKVVVPKAVGGTKAVRDFLPINQFFLVEPGVVVSETYTVVGCFKSRTEALNLLAYVKTSFCRYFIGLRKLTQNMSVDTWRWVPAVDFKRKWSDNDLFKHFSFTSTEKNRLLEKVKDWS